MAIYRKKACHSKWTWEDKVAMRQHNDFCEIECDRIVPGADDCSASKKVKVSKWQKEFGI